MPAHHDVLSFDTTDDWTAHDLAIAMGAFDRMHIVFSLAMHLGIIIRKDDQRQADRLRRNPHFVEELFMRFGPMFVGPRGLTFPEQDSGWLTLLSHRSLARPMA